jgi:hypothetical protein
MAVGGRQGVISPSGTAELEAAASWIVRSTSRILVEQKLLEKLRIRQRRYKISSRSASKVPIMRIVGFWAILLTICLDFKQPALVTDKLEEK